jgi:hypothetical protein
MRYAQLHVLTASQKTLSHSRASLCATNDLRYSRGARVEVQAGVLRQLAALDYGGRGRNERAAHDETLFADFNRSNIHGAGFWSVMKLSSIDDKCIISKDN